MVVLVAICDLDERRLAAAADRNGVDPEGRYTDYRRMLRVARLDAIYATLQPTQVLPIVKDVLDAGIHIFTERPPGIGVELHYLDVPLDELWRRIELRNAEGAWGTAPITREQLEEWAGYFEAPDATEIELFDAPQRGRPASSMLRRMPVW